MAPQYVTILKFTWVAAAVFLLIFLVSYLWDRTKLRNGIWFNLFFYTFWADVGATILVSGINGLIYPVGFLFLFLLFCIGMLFAFQSVLLLWNAAIVWRRESHSLANMLTLYLGIAIIIMPFIARAIQNHLPLFWSTLFISFPTLCIAYAVFWFYNYLTVLVLYQLYWPRHNKDFIIVLGAGLMDGDQVTPLLAQRIDRGIHFYQIQKKRTGKAPKMIFSGGQGGDETLPEGEAMRRYAIAHDVDVNDAIAETESRTTLENMSFSKKIIDSFKLEKPKVIFVSNNYHTFRAAIFAKTVGLKAAGIGSRTARFFLPNAVVREYIAIVMRQKRLHTIMLGLIFVFSLFWSVLSAHPEWIAGVIQQVQQVIDSI